MGHTLHLQQTCRRARVGIIATLRAIARAVGAEHDLALHAAAKAASPRKTLAEVRAMYVPPGESQQESDGIAQTTKSAR